MRSALSSSWSRFLTPCGLHLHPHLVRLRLEIGIVAVLSALEQRLGLGVEHLQRGRAHVVEAGAERVVERPLTRDGGDRPLGGHVEVRDVLELVEPALRDAGLRRVLLDDLDRRPLEAVMSGFVVELVLDLAVEHRVLALGRHLRFERRGALLLPSLEGRELAPFRERRDGRLPPLVGLARLHDMTRHRRPVGSLHDVLRRSVLGLVRVVVGVHRALRAAGVRSRWRPYRD